MRRLLRVSGHGVGVMGAALGIESLATSALPGVVRLLPLGLRFLQLRTGGVLGGALVLLGAMLLSATRR